MSERNARFFEAEAQKLDGWADDLKVGLEREIKEMDRQIREARRAASAAVTLEEKLAGQRQVKSHEAQRNQKRRSLFDAQDQVDDTTQRRRVSFGSPNPSFIGMDVANPILAVSRNSRLAWKICLKEISEPLQRTPQRLRECEGEWRLGCATTFSLGLLRVGGLQIASNWFACPTRVALIDTVK